MSRRATLHIAASFGAGTEKAFKTTVEIDRLIDNLRSTEYHNVSRSVDPSHASHLVLNGMLQCTSNRVDLPC